MSELELKERFQNEDCERYAEIVENEALGESRRSEADVAFVREHLCSCPDCRAFESALTGLSRSHEQGTEALVTGVKDAYYGRLDRQHRRRATVRNIVGVFAAAAAVLLIFWVTARRDETALRHERVDRAPVPAPVAFSAPKLAEGAPAIDGRAAVMGAVLAEGSRIVTDQGDSLIVSGDPRYSIGLDAKTAVVFKDLARGRVGLVLEQGLVAVSLDKGQGVRFTVDGRFAQVTVTGTLFSVEATDDDVAVRVARGSVRVESPDWQDGPVDVGEGWSLSARTRGIEPLKSISRYHLYSLLRLTPDQATAGDESAVPGADEGAGARATAGTEDPQPVRAVRGRKHSDRELDSAESPGALLSPGDLIRAARVCRRNRDWGCAVAAYKRVTESYPESPEAATVLLPLAEIELENLGRPGRALDYYDQYYRHHPNGPLAQEALYGKCRALGALGRPDREAAELERFVDRYPGSVYAPNARARLKSLEVSK